MNELEGRKTLVLGANEPVAAAVALAFAKAGADVAVTSSSGDPEEAFAMRPLRRAIEAEGRQAIADIADLGNGSSVQIAVRQIAKQLGRLDIVVIASSETLDKPSERVTDAEWSRTIGFNLSAYFYAARAAAREFSANEAVGGVKGRIVALLPAVAPMSSIRLAARRGAESLMQALADEWRDQGVLVSLVDLTVASTEEAAVSEVMRIVR